MDYDPIISITDTIIALFTKLPEISKVIFPVIRAGNNVFIVHAVPVAGIKESPAASRRSTPYSSLMVTLLLSVGGVTALGIALRDLIIIPRRSHNWYNAAKLLIMVDGYV